MKGILKLKKHNENKEIEYELNFLKSLSIAERFKLMFNKSKEAYELLVKSGHRKTPKIIKRK